jgi:hypothetical protein
MPYGIWVDLRAIRLQLSILGSNGETALLARPIPWTAVGPERRLQTRVVWTEVTPAFIK